MHAETQWQADRAYLRYLQRQHPTWSHKTLAQALHRSRTWVKKWLKRFSFAAPDSTAVLKSRPSVRNHPTPPKALNPLLVERILAIRDHPPENLGRTPGPKAIAYYLQRDPLLEQAGLKPPASPTFIWRVLDQFQRISRPKPPKPPQPKPRPDPLAHWEVDFKDASSVTVGPEGKKQHLVEILNIVDEGTSILVDTVAGEDFNAETALKTMSEVLKRHGLPQQITFDRDPRWVGSYSTRDFPSAFVKYWSCLGVGVDICPPRRPDMNGFVERYNGNLGRECLAVQHPATLSQVREAIAKYKEHYNRQRPHQGLSCGNRPPLVAFPDLPALKSLPLVVDPDSWLKRFHGLRYVGKVDQKGTIRVDKHHYHCGKELAGKYVQAEVDGEQGQLVVWEGPQELKRLKLKGLIGGELSYEEYLKVRLKEAQSERRLASLRARARAGILFDS